MHPLRHPRNAVLIGVLFIAIAVVYWFVPSFGSGHVDFAGMTMLAALGIAMSVMAYVLIAGSPRE